MHVKFGLAYEWREAFPQCAVARCSTLYDGVRSFGTNRPSVKTAREDLAKRLGQGLDRGGIDDGLRN